MEVVVLGGGYAGVAISRALSRRLPNTVGITLVDDTGEHLVQHELHRIIRRPELASTLQIDLATLVPNAAVHIAEVISIDTSEPCVALADGQTLEPTVLVVCLGAVTATYGLPGIRTNGIPLKRMDHAMAIRQRVEQLAVSDRVVIGGAGLSGIQVAGELAAIADGPHVTIVEQQDTVAPGFPTGFRRAIQAALAAGNVEVLTNTTIERAHDDHLLFADGSIMSFELLVWTGGITGSAAMNGHRPTVQADLRLDKRTFALGDAAQVIDDQDNRVPAAAQTAVRQAQVGARNVSRLVRAERSDDLIFEPRLHRYRFQSPGWAVSIGDDAVASIGEQVVRGRSAVAMKATIEAGYLGSLGRVGEAVDVLRKELLGRP